MLEAGTILTFEQILNASSVLASAHSVYVVVTTPVIPNSATMSVLHLIAFMSSVQLFRHRFWNFNNSERMGTELQT